MATILKSDIDNWYTQLNAMRTRVGLGAIAVPTIVENQTPVTSAQMTSVNTQTNALKADTYLRYAQYYSYGDTSTGSIVKTTTKTALSSSVTEFNKIKCRNTCRNQFSGYSDHNDDSQRGQNSVDGDDGQNNNNYNHSVCADDNRNTEHGGPSDGYYYEESNRSTCSDCSEDSNCSQQSDLTDRNNNSQDTDGGCTNSPVTDIYNTYKPY